MSAKGYELGGKYSQDPIGSELPRGKNAERRLSRSDPGWTPTEQHIKNRLMRQFMRGSAEGPGGNTAAWRESELWCRACGLYMRLDGSPLCRRCHESDLECEAEPQDMPSEWRP